MMSKLCVVSSYEKNLQNDIIFTVVMHGYVQVHTEYEVFIQPFYKSVLGLPSPTRIATTLQEIT